jgi:hypothetical protein
MTRRIDELLEPILADFRASGSPPPRIEPSDWQTWQPSESAFLRADDGSGMGVWINLDAPPAQQFAELADQFQDWAVENLPRVHQPTNWPRCPAHPETHPMQAQLRGDEATWVCPAGADIVFRIGHYPEAMI